MIPFHTSHASRTSSGLIPSIVSMEKSASFRSSTTSWGSSLVLIRALRVVHDDVEEVVVVPGPGSFKHPVDLLLRELLSPGGLRERPHDPVGVRVDPDQVQPDLAIHDVVLHGPLLGHEANTAELHGIRVDPD